MRIQTIQNNYNNNYNPHFGALKIWSKTSSYDCSSPWPQKILDEFVENEQVKRFVKVMQAQGEDVTATYFADGYFPAKITLSTENIPSPITGIHPRDLKDFSATEALADYQRALEKQRIQKPEKVAQNLGDSINNFAEDIQTKSETKPENKKSKWWQFWK